jgi:hypothetical protein
MMNALTVNIKSIADNVNDNSTFVVATNPARLFAKLTFKRLELFPTIEDDSSEPEFNFEFEPLDA